MAASASAKTPTTRASVAIIDDHMRKLLRAMIIGEELFPLPDSEDNVNDVQGRYHLPQGEYDNVVEV